MSGNGRLADSCPVWRVALDLDVADGLRREVGSDRRAAAVEKEWGEAMPVGARLLRVEPDEPVGVFVEGSWPHADYPYRHTMIWRRLRAAEPTAPPRDRGPVAATLGELAYVGREQGFLTEELTQTEIAYAEREAAALGRGSGGSL